jgi:hypothetical protein
MFNWPFYDPRFWVPVLPLFVAAIVQVPVKDVRQSIFNLPRYAMLVVYVSLGLASLGYLTYTSLNRSVFARTQANGVYRNEYETVFFGKPQSDTAKEVNRVTVHVIERYNK